MKYATEQLKFIDPELSNALLEAIAVLDSPFRLKFSFAALAIREIVRVLYQSHGLKKDAAAEIAHRDCPWLDESGYFWDKKDEKEYLTRRGDLLLSLYRNRTPYDFTEGQNAQISELTSRLLSSISLLNKNVHNIALSIRLDEKQGRQMIEKVLGAFEEVVRLKRLVLDIIAGGEFADAATISVGLIGGSYVRVIPEKDA